MMIWTSIITLKASSLPSFSCSFTYEIIIVDDGSRDGTARVAMEYSQRLGSDVLRLLQLKKNKGKGGALRTVGGHSVGGSEWLRIEAMVIPLFSAYDGS